MEDASGAMYMNIVGMRYTLSWHDDNERILFGMVEARSIRCDYE